MLKIHQDFTGKTYRDGYISTPTITTVLVSASAGGTQLIAANPQRTYLLIQNIGSFNVTVCLDGSVPTLTSGIVLNSLAAIILLYEQGDLVYNAVTAIATTGATNVLVQEGVGV